MRTAIIHTLIALGAAAFPFSASANTAPHWNTSNIDCIDCHADHMGPKTACDFCHNNDSGVNYAKTSAPKMATHSSSVMESTQYGTWSRTCVDCHDPHVSAQCATPLVSGNFNSYSSGGGTTTFNISTFSVHDPAWQNPGGWNAKSGPERGLIMVVEGLIWDAVQNKYVDFSSEIQSATASAVTVLGEISQISTVRSFKILYGQYLKGTINGSPTSFPGSPAGFAYDESETGYDATPNGVCQVCHTQTEFWRRDGSRANHFNGENCSKCHEHELGFRPSCNACHGYPPIVDSPAQVNGLVWTPSTTEATSAGAHKTHAVDDGIPCETCHFSGMPVSPVVDDYKLQIGFNIPGLPTAGNIYDGKALNPAYSFEATNGTTVTTTGGMSCVVYCHSNGTSVSTGVLQNLPSPSWISGSTDCTSCHSYPPAYAQDQPKSNSHQRHIDIGFKCFQCHYATTTDGTTIAAAGKHGNGQYDVVGAPTFFANGQNRALQLVYTFDAGGGTCSTNSCHGYFGFNTPIRWGRTYLQASPSIVQGDVDYEINFNVNVTDCGVDACNLPYTCSFDWGDGTSDERVNCSASHIYQTEGSYNVTWNVWDSKNHSMDGYKTNQVIAEKVYGPPSFAPPTATVNPSTGVVTVTIPEVSAAGVPVAKAYIYWGDRKRSVVVPPIQPVQHIYPRDGIYNIRIVIYDANHETQTFTYQDEPSLSVSVDIP